MAQLFFGGLYLEKIRDILLFSCPFVLLELFAIIFIATCVSDNDSFYSLVGSTAALFMIWFGGCIFLLFKKPSCKKLSKLLLISGMISIFALLLEKRPDDKVWNATAFAYRWEDRVRFPIGAENLNHILTNNSVFSSFKAYRSAEAQN